MVGRDAVAAEHAVEEGRERTLFMLVHDGDLGALPSALHFTELRGERLHCLGPGDGDELVTVALHGAAEAIGIVETLQARLPARAERTLIDRMLRIALGLDRASIADFDDQAAAGGALTAGGGVIVGDARGRLVGRDEIRDELLDVTGRAADGGRGGASDGHDLEEVAALDA